MKLTAAERHKLFTHLVDAMHREGVLHEAVAELPDETRQAFTRAVADDEGAAARVAAMSEGEQDRAYHAMLLEGALMPKPEDDLFMRADVEIDELYTKRFNGEDVTAWLEREVAARPLTPEQSAAKREQFRGYRAKMFNEHLRALIELGPLDEGDRAADEESAHDARAVGVPWIRTGKRTGERTGKGT